MKRPTIAVGVAIGSLMLRGICIGKSVQELPPVWQTIAVKIAISERRLVKDVSVPVIDKSKRQSSLVLYGDKPVQVVIAIACSLLSKESLVVIGPIPMSIRQLRVQVVLVLLQIC
jgi:hypothetical protein